MAIIYSFGDSITYGAWDVERSGWAARLRQYLDDLQEKNPDYYCLFYNLGIPGETTDGLVKRFENETNARKSEREEPVFIFAYGANDSAIHSVENKFRVSREAFKDNLKQTIKKASAFSEKILLVNIIPVDEKKNGVPGKKIVRLNKYMEEYNMVLRELADQFKLPLVDVYSIFMKAGHEKLLNVDDGLHPNAEGHQIMFEAIKPVVQKMLGWE
jgi:lysophospholipase L1-like esterase